MKDTQSVRKTYYIYEIDVNKYSFMHYVRDIMGEEFIVFSSEKFPTNYFIVSPYFDIIGKIWNKVMYNFPKKRRPKFVRIEITKYIGETEVWYSKDIWNLPYNEDFTGIYFYKEMTFKFMSGINGGNFGKNLMTTCLVYYINKFLKENENNINRL